MLVCQTAQLGAKFEVKIMRYKDTKETRMPYHNLPSEYARKTVIIPAYTLSSTQDTELKYRVEDWWDRVSGHDVVTSALDKGNPAAALYIKRMRELHKDNPEAIPQDKDHLYGKIDGLGHILHLSEVEAGIISE